MSEHVPLREVGDRVRIMQTTTMQRLGLAGAVGTVQALGDADRFGELSYRLILDGPEKAIVVVHGSSLSTGPSDAG